MLNGAVERVLKLGVPHACELPVVSAMVLMAEDNKVESFLVFFCVNKQSSTEPNSKLLRSPNALLCGSCCSAGATSVQLPHMKARGAVVKRELQFAEVGGVRRNIAVKSKRCR